MIYYEPSLACLPKPVHKVGDTARNYLPTSNIYCLELRRTMGPPLLHYVTVEERRKPRRPTSIVYMAWQHFKHREQHMSAQLDLLLVSLNLADRWSRR